MKNIPILFLTLLIISCADNTSKKNSIDITSIKQQKKTTKIETKTEIEPFKISYDKSLVSTYEIVNQETTGTKTFEKRLSEYETDEIVQLPKSKRLTLSIVVPYDISEESLTHTLKSIVDKKTKSDNDIDEIVIFAYDNKADVGRAYTFGKLVWAPKGETENLTSSIAKNNIRNSYQFHITIKEKVGEITKNDKPTKRELAIYNMITADENIGIPEDKLYKMVMKKFNIKTAEEAKNIFLKVSVYKLY